MQDELEQQGQKIYPLKHKLGLAASAFLPISGLDLLAHLGPTGLLIGAIAGYVAWELGPDALSGIKRELSTLAPARVAQEKPRGRSIPDKLLGRYPAEQETDDAMDDDYDVYDEEDGDGDGDGDEEENVRSLPHPEPIARPSSADYRLPIVVRASDPAREVLLADNLGLDIDEMIEAGVFIAGMKGSGKSTVAARLMEQVGKFPIAQIVYDIKGDYVSLVEEGYFQYGLIATKEQQYDADFILSGQRQVVVDLRTFPSMEYRARIIANLNTRLLKYAMSLPEERRVPWFVHLDEAQQYVSQQQPVGIDGPTWKAATQSVMNLGVLGRAYGAVPCLYTQRIASIHKDVISQQELRIFMKASMDIDLKRYRESINARAASDEAIQAFRAGDAAVLLPDGKQFMTHFLPRESKHGSHTPHLEQALRVQQAQRRAAPLPVPLMPIQHDELAPDAQSPRPALPANLQRAYEQYRPGISYRDLGEALGVSKDTAKAWVLQLKAAGWVKDAV